MVIRIIFSMLFIQFYEIIQISRLYFAIQLKQNTNWRIEKNVVKPNIK